MAPQRYESLAQAAERTGISPKTLRRRIAAGQLPVYSCGRRILRVRPEDVDEMLSDHWSGSRRKRAGTTSSRQARGSA